MFSVPFLAQFGQKPTESASIPDLVCGPDGLLHRSGIEIPLIEELLDAAASPSGLIPTTLYTSVTRQADDVPDPDLVRARSGRSGLVHDAGLDTIITKMDEQADPDRIRNAFRHALVTTYTSGHVDQPDPDESRRCHHHRRA